MAGKRIVPKIFKEEEGAEEQKGEHARLSAYIGAIAVGDLVKTTLGPKGMDKILQPLRDNEKAIFTNDGATILKSLPVDNAAAKIIIDTSKTQDLEVGDGTTSVAVLAAELLREAEKLVTGYKFHPQVVIRGWRKAVTVARQALEQSALDHKDSKEEFRADLINIARTTLSSKILASHKDHFAKLAVDAVLRLKGRPEIEHIQIIKKTGASLEDSYLEEGYILDKKIGVGQPKRLENAKILLANTALDTDKIKIYAAKIKVDSVAKVAEIEQAEKKKMKDKVKKIIEHDINCFISRQLIYNLPEQMFSDAKIMAIEHADFEGIERLGFVLGGEIASTFDHPERVKLGHCKLIEEIMIGEDRVIRFSGCAQGEACTIVLRAASRQILDEAERSIHDAICVLMGAVKDSRTVLGGGCSEMLMSNAVDESARATAGKEAIAIESFARAVRALPTIIADNAGYDSSELITQLRAKHHQEYLEGNKSPVWGLDMEKGEVGNMRSLKVTESLRSKLMVLISAHEAAEMIVRVDEIIKTAPRKRTRRH